MPYLKQEHPPLDMGTGSPRAILSKLRNWFSFAAQLLVICYGILWIVLLTKDYFLALHQQSATYTLPFLFSPQRYVCRPPLPHPPEGISVGDPLFRAASQSLHRYLNARTSKDDIDSLTVAVVTSSGPVFQQGYGVLKANETEPDNRGSVDENTIYRIASITKMFNVLETLILRDRGVLNWDDPVTKFIPEFTHNPYSWQKYLSNSSVEDLKALHEPITIRQLASHMSGLGRDYPPPTTEWPINPSHKHPEKSTVISPGIFRLHDDFPPTKEQILEAMAELPLIAPPYSYPVYSNTGFDLLGWVNVEANAMSGNGSEQPRTYADLLRRDVFYPVGMNSTSFSVSPESAPRIAVAARDNEDTDLDFTDSLNPSGGQYSSIRDLSSFMQIVLDPHGKRAILSPYTVREWLRPLHGWSDDLTQVGAPWEIIKYLDSWGRRQQFYAKGGNLWSYHSQFGISPVSSYGVIVLLTGRYTNTAQLAHEAINIFQPVFDKILERAARKAYGGLWTSDSSLGNDNQVQIRVTDGSLWVDRFILRGMDLLAFIQERKPGKAKAVALWSTGPERVGEFRIAIGRPTLNSDPLAGCEPYWVSIDAIHANGAPIDLIYFDTDDISGQRVMRIPSAGISLKQTSRKY